MRLRVHGATILVHPLSLCHGELDFPWWETRQVCHSTMVQWEASSELCWRYIVGPWNQSPTTPVVTVGMECEANKIVDGKSICLKFCVHPVLLYTKSI
ncbi:hypothetical protein EDC04DRAFT_1099036 [Pisolithus marmoratus]|nr:hypothetical protein EDC04DRAFT_1099036 [Pisolithus marmoratus]